MYNFFVGWGVNFGGTQNVGFWYFLVGPRNHVYLSCRVNDATSQIYMFFFVVVFLGFTCVGEATMLLLQTECRQCQIKVSKQGVILTVREFAFFLLGTTKLLTLGWTPLTLCPSLFMVRWKPPHRCHRCNLHFSGHI